jgi:hypothetical protein
MEATPMKIEDSLRAALRPQDPGPAFTAGVMAAVEPARSRPRRTGRPLQVALAASVVVTAVGLGLLQQQRAERRRIETTRQQLVLALEITSERLNQVQQRLYRPGKEENGT